MGVKINPSLLARFGGHHGRRHLIECIAAQQIVASNSALARQLVKLGTLVDVAAGEAITTQGDTSNDLYLIISGEVEVRINDRPIAARHPGQHVGEMALLEP